MELDTIYIRLKLPGSVTVKGVTYGMPRVGNHAWVNWFKSKASVEFIAFTRFPGTGWDDYSF